MNDLSNLPAIGVAVFLAVCLIVDVQRNIYRLLAGRTAVLISAGYWYLLEAIKTPEELRKYTQDEYNFGLFCFVLSVLAFLASYQVSRWNLFAPLARRMSALNDPRVLWRLLVGGTAIGFGSLLIYVDFNVAAFFGGLTGMMARWSGGLGRGQYGSWRTILYELQMFLKATVPLAVCLAFMKRAPFWQRGMAALFVLWMFLHTLFSGSRTPLIPILLCVAGAVFWNAGPRLRRALLIGGIVPSLVGGYLLAAIIVAGRNEGKFNVSSATDVEYVGVEMFRELLFVVHNQREGLPMELGFTYFTQLVNPIPRAIWPGKPDGDAGLILARAYGAVDKEGRPTLTVSPGFLGEAYLNFGFLGMLILPAAAGVLVRAWDRLLPIAAMSCCAFLVYATGLATIFASGRSFNFSTFYGLAALFVLLVVFERMGWTATRNRFANQSPIRRMQSRQQISPQGFARSKP